MRLSIRGALLALAISPLASVAAAQQATGAKIAYVNSAAILDAAPGRAEAEQKLEQEMQQLRTQINRMGDSLNVMLEAYGKEQASLSQAQRESRQKAIEAKRAEFQQRANQLEQQAARRQQEVVQPILDRIREILDDIRQEGGYAMIFDAQPGTNLIVSADKNLDLTDRVIARLRASGAARPSAGQRPAGAPMNSAPAGVTRPKNNP